MKLLLAVLGISLVLAAPVAASAECKRPSAGAQLLDAAFVRPIALAGAVASGGLFAATLPLTFFTGTSTESAYLFVAAPVRFAAARKLGDYRAYRDGLNLYGTRNEPIPVCP